MALLNKNRDKWLQQNSSKPEQNLAVWGKNHLWWARGGKSRRLDFTHMQSDYIQWDEWKWMTSAYDEVKNVSAIALRFAHSRDPLSDDDPEHPIVLLNAGFSDDFTHSLSSRSLLWCSLSRPSSLPKWLASFSFKIIIRRYKSPRNSVVNVPPTIEVSLGTHDWRSNNRSLFSCWWDVSEWARVNATLIKWMKRG